MPDIDRLNADTGWIDLGFVERERTPRKIIEMGIRHHLAGLSLSNTVILLEDLGVERSRTAIHDWVQKANLQPKGGESPDRVAVDQKAIQINDEQYWLYAAVDPETNRILHSRLFPTYTIAIAREFLTEASRETRRQRRRVSRRRRRRSHRRTPPRRAQLPRSITRLQEPGRTSFVRYNDEPLRSQTASATSIQPPQKHGFKPTPSGGIMSKLTPPMPKPALNAIRTIVFDTSYSTN